MKKIVLGTANPHKLEEIKAIVDSSIFNDIEFILAPKDFNPDETGSTFEENSFIKAQEAAKLTGYYAIADDTGLCVDALGGAPGLYSARYAPTPEEKISKLIKALENIQPDKRTAKFVCTMVLVNPKGEKIHVSTGEIPGFITQQPHGTHGFGYDPVFFIPELNKTMADLTLNEKNTLSHRAKALLPMLEWIENNLD